MTFTHQKVAFEQYHLAVDFTNEIVGDSIESATVSAFLDDVDVSDTILDVTKQEISGSMVYFWVRGGEPSKTYTINVNIYTLSDACYYQCIKLIIER